MRHQIEASSCVEVGKAVPILGFSEIETDLVIVIEKLLPRIYIQRTPSGLSRPATL